MADVSAGEPAKSPALRRATYSVPEAGKVLASGSIAGSFRIYNTESLEEEGARRPAMGEPTSVNSAFESIRSSASEPCGKHLKMGTRNSPAPCAVPGRARGGRGLSWHATGTAWRPGAPRV